MKKLLALLLALVMVMALVACQPTTQPNQGTDKPATNETQATEKPATADNQTQQPEATEEPVEEKYWFNEFDVMKLDKLEYGKDYTSLYKQVGKNVSIADVVEDPDTGFAYIEVDGELHELGLDFLTMAMVYNNEPAGDYKTTDDVYAAWWRLYITRWNYLLPEIPLYSNEYYDVYNAKITGVMEHQTNPFWSPARALIDWKSEKEDDSIIIGNTTALSGQFRYPTFGKNSPGAADNDIGFLVNEYYTVAPTKEGGYEWNETVVDSHEETINEDGSKTFKIKIKEDLLFSDGSPVTAKDYVAFTLAMLSPVGTQAATREMNGQTILGWQDAYQLYTGPGSEAGTKELAGLRLYDEYTFGVTVPADFIPYFYDVTYASFLARFAAAWVGEFEIKDDGNGCYLPDEFYAKDGDTYKMAEHIKSTGMDTTKEAYAKYPWSGPYAVESYDTTDSSAVLVKNEYYKGNYEGTKPGIGKVVYKKIVSATQLEDFKAGGLDVLSGITGGAATDEALKAADESNGAYVYTHYSRAGYGKLGFRADYGPVQFVEVRQAIAYCMNRDQFAKDFTGGYGGVVHGPYYTGSWMYKAADKQGMLLDSYPTSADSAIAVLEAGGWVYDKDGNEYKEGVRYKMIPGDIISEDDKNYKSQDGAYVTTEVDGNFYMPLVINWYGTVENEFTDLLQTGLRENPNVATAGMVVYSQTGDFQPMLDELYQQAAYGFYAGTPMYCAFNFATGFNSAIYDYSFAMTIDPATYDNDSQYYIKDYADILWLNK